MCSMSAILITSVPTFIPVSWFIATQEIVSYTWEINTIEVTLYVEETL